MQTHDTTKQLDVLYAGYATYKQILHEKQPQKDGEERTEKVEYYK